MVFLMIIAFQCKYASNKKLWLPTNKTILFLVNILYVSVGQWKSEDKTLFPCVFI